MNNNIEQEFFGEIISPGITIGETCHYQAGSIEQTAVYRVDSIQISREMERLKSAIDKSKEELSRLSKNIAKSIGENEAKIFQAHIALLEDRQLFIKIQGKTEKENVNVEYAVKSVFEEFEDIFAKMDDEYLKDRGTDFAEVKRRVLSHLTGETGRFLCRHQCKVRKESARIILTKELMPSMISLLENKNIQGFITRHGGKNSHAGILARAIGIPYITGINVIEKIKCETKVIIDGSQGKVIFDPSEVTIASYKELLEKEKKRKDELDKNVGPIIKTKKGTEVELFANVIGLIDIDHLKQYRLAGVGLLRTEFLFLDNKEFPTKDEQAKVYVEFVKKTEGKPVTFRLFDIGGDKKMQSLKFEEEENPLLGLRGIRYLMKYKKILEDQVAAICEAEKNGVVKILYPMISNVDELHEVNGLVKNVLLKHNLLDRIKVGMMFEVPSVVIDPVPFLKLIDFASIGSNDLVQYVYGVDRNNSSVSHLYKQNSSVIYKLIKRLLFDAEKTGVDISLCGEIDFNTDFFENLIEIGIRKFSISPITAPMVIERIKSLEI